MFELIRSLRIDAHAGDAVGQAVVPAAHPIFADHFPDLPLFPGSFLLELAAQVAGPLGEEVTLVRHGLTRGAVLGLVRRAVFPRPCLLPATLRFTAQVRHSHPARVTVLTAATASAGIVLRTELVLAMIEIPPEWAGVVEARRERVARWSAADAS